MLTVAVEPLAAHTTLPRLGVSVLSSRVTAAVWRARADGVSSHRRVRGDGAHDQAHDQECPQPMTVPIPPGAVPAGPVVPYEGGPLVMPDEHVPDRQGIIACLSNTTRNGPWALPRLFRALAIMGEVKLDLRHVQLGAGTSEIQVRAFMGNIEITVPHNLRLECAGTPFMGEFSVKRKSTRHASPDAPLVRITGGAFMGAVKVRVIDPGAPSAMDKVRAWVKGE
jgi:hypothetical protein